jgi:hypothetical protein
MSTIEIKHGDAVVTVHRRTPRSVMRRLSWDRRAREWLKKNYEDYDVTYDDVWLSFYAWSNLASRISVTGSIPIPLPNGNTDTAKLCATFDEYLDMDDPAGNALVDEIVDAMNDLDRPFDDALAPEAPNDPEKKTSGKSGK